MRAPLYAIPGKAEHPAGPGAYDLAGVSTGVGGGGGGGSTMYGGDVTHGEQLTLAHVGPWTFQGVAQGSESLSTITGSQLAERLSNWHARPSWIPGTDYVDTNASSNVGGIVPAGGMTIDGMTVPAGTWVVQNRTFTGPIVIEGKAGAAGPFVGVLFRGCRMRASFTAPGFYSQNAQSTGGAVRFHYCDAGGTSLAAVCESAFESSHNLGASDRMYVLRCHISRVTSAVFLRNNGDAAIENYIREVTDFGDPGFHLNGVANSGGETATLWKRNNIVLAKQTGSTQITDVIQFAADNGSYPGGGTNVDGSTGYQVLDNLLGGANYVLQFGRDVGRGTTMANCNVAGNKITTTLYANGGESGLGYKGPLDWTSNGNTWTGNTWADGANAGVAIASSAVAHD